MSGKGPKAVAPARRGRAGIAAALVVLVAGGGAFAWIKLRKPPITPVLPELVETLEPDLKGFLKDVYAVAAAAPKDAAKQADLGKACFFNGQFVAAQANFENAAALDDSMALAKYYAGRSMQELGKPEALAQYRRTCKEHPTFAPAFYAAGARLRDEGKSEEAEAAFQKVRELAPKEPDGWMGLGDLYIRRRDFAKAAQVLETAVSLRDEETTAHFLLSRAYAGLDRPYDADRERLRAGDEVGNRWMHEDWGFQQTKWSRSIADMTGIAHDLVYSGKAAEGIALLEGLYAAHPREVGVLNNLAGAMIEVQRYDRAIELLREALRIKPDNYSCHVNMAWALMSLGRFDDALEAADTAVKHAPTIGQTHHMRGLVLTRLRRFDDAIAACNKAIECNPRDGRFRVALGQAFVGAGRHAEAKRQFEQGTTFSPTFVDGWISLCKADLALGDEPGARAAYFRAASLRPDYPEVRNLAAQFK